ncbi:MAG: glycosyltransferase family 4 protein, partial [Magnetococcales bacterium]|nr:glycosyltransferase family 4 protein [Magnetococcales bacterium]
VGKDRQQWYYQWMARRLGIGARVCFTGGQQKVDEFYGAADAAVLPTLYDPFPNVAMEAMASGLPMATTLSCGAKDLIQHGANGLLADALDQEKWQQNLHTLMDEQKRQTMGQLARQSAEPLTMEVMGLRLLSLYQALYAGGLRDGRL